MSRAYKASLVDETDDLSTGSLNAAGVEKLSGADLEQLRLASLNGSNPAVDSAGTKTVGSNLKYRILANITADGVNTVTVDSTVSLFVGQAIAILDSDGVSLHGAASRNITAINHSTRVVTYDGADVSATVVAGDFVVTVAEVSNAKLSGADLLRYAGDQ